MIYEKTIIQGSSVRNFFQHDLQTIGAQGDCLLPEWICSSMVNAVIAANWRPRFYPVLPPSEATTVLQADLSSLYSQCKRMRGRYIVLFAHPVGYIDSSLIDFMSNYSTEMSYRP